MIMLYVIVIAALVGASGGGLAVSHWYYAPKVENLTIDPRDARTAAIGERAARDAVTRQCEAGNAATSQAADFERAAREAIERATRELNNAQGDDADPIRAQFDELRREQQGAAGAPGN